MQVCKLRYWITRLDLLRSSVVSKSWKGYVMLDLKKITFDFLMGCEVLKQSILIPWHSQFCWVAACGDPSYPALSSFHSLIYPPRSLAYYN